MSSNGRVVYEGKSMLNGEEIVAILTSKSNNDKTGNMAQLWILPKNENPFSALWTLNDECVCGDCPLRRGKGGYCYVNVAMAPNNVWKTYNKGKYEKGLKGIRPMKVRLGAYGDPAALPVEVIESILKACKLGVTGYTHQWRKCDKKIAEHCRASCDNESDYFEAKSLGWKTFRIVDSYDEILPEEKVCLNAKDGRQCQDCMICGGKGPDIAIKAHGSMVSRRSPGERTKSVQE